MKDAFFDYIAHCKQECRETGGCPYPKRSCYDCIRGEWSDGDSGEFWADKTAKEILQYYIKKDVV